jgi:hypothetical protein
MPILTITCIMNLLTKYSGLILLSALFLSSCEDPSQLGLEVQPGDDQVGVLYSDTFNIQTEVIQRNDFTTALNDRLFAGGYNDPELGNLNAEGYFQYLPVNENKVIQDQSAFDSMTVSFGLSYVYGNQNTQQPLSLHRLTQDLQFDSSYTSSDKASYLPEAEAIITIPTNILADTTSTKVLFRTDNLGNEIFSAIKTDSTLLKKETFRQRFKGLAIVASQGEEKQAAMGFSLPSLNSVSTIYYHYPSGDTTKRDSVLFNYSSANAASFSRIVADRSGTPLASLTPSNSVPSPQLGNRAYVQGGTGVSTIIRFPGLESLQEKGNISITRAELIIIPIDKDNLTPPPALTLSELYEDGVISSSDNRPERFVLDENSYVDGRGNSAEALSFLYDANTGRYRVNISHYINAVINGIKPNHGLALSPSPINGSTNRLIFNTLQGQETSLKLKIYYVPLNQ